MIVRVRGILYILSLLLALEGLEKHLFAFVDSAPCRLT